MLPTITDTEPSRKPRHAATRRGVDAARAIDHVLFAPQRWFALSVDNRRVPGVVVPSLDSGLDLVGRGAVASIVGTLRAEVRVVDVDVAGQRGHQARGAVAQWCRREGLWHLERSSGGPDGHAHVFVACAGRVDTLETFVRELRGNMGVGKTRLEVRTAVRPLSAPHRTGVITHPVGSLPAALEALRRHSWATDTPQRAVASVERVGTTLPPARRRSRRDLPEQWQTYVDTGVTPTITGEDQSRSTVEAIATGFLLRAGHDADTAWRVITTAHPDAFTKARGSHRRWVAWVWNRAVADDTEFSPAVQVDGHLRLDVDTAHARLTALAWTVSPRARRSLLRVGYTVLDRVLRSGSRRVPVPERDLVLDTGISDRKTIRAALTALSGHVGVLDTTTFDSNVRAATSFEFEIPASDLGGVLQIPPPSLHTPLPPGIWSGLPTSAPQLWSALNRAPGPVALPEVVFSAQLAESLDTPLSLGQIRAARHVLTQLALAGLAECTEAGEWIARHDVNHAHLERATATRATLQDQVAAERATYRAGRSTDWNVQQAAALKANYARERAWWGGLPREQRTRQHAHYQRQFTAMSIVEQQDWKERQVHRRRRAGVDESARHQKWADSLSWDEVVARSAQRGEDFARLAGPMRQAKAIAWARHREQFAIPRGTPTWQSRLEHAHALPHPGADRDEAFWESETATGYDYQPQLAPAVSN